MGQEYLPSKRCSMILLLATGFFMAQLCEAIRLGRNLSKEEVSTVWIGISEDELSLLRLVLNENGTGKGGYLYRADEPITFHITSWSYGRRLTVNISFDDGEERNFSSTIFGAVVGSHMELTISGKGWKSDIKLRKEDSLLEDWKKLAAATDFLFPVTEPSSEDVRVD